jgi:hypothetical protein
MSLRDDEGTAADFGGSMAGFGGAAESPRLGPPQTADAATTTSMADKQNQ